jgi:hypothetical protein
MTMKRNRLDDIADRSRAAGVTDWLFASVLLAFVVFAIIGWRLSTTEAGTQAQPAQWVDSGARAPRALEAAAAAPQPQPPG